MPAKKTTKKNKGGRPTKYTKDICKKVEVYLEQCSDEHVQVVKQSNSDKGYEMYENKLRVKLPTTDGFARFIGVARSTLYKWEEEHQEFSDALDIIRLEQQERLLNSGLSGDYNPTIAKLVLSSNHGMAERKDVTSEGKAIEGNTIVFADFDEAED